MLQAQTKEGRLVTLAQLTTSEIEFHREHTQFYCPTCRNPVMVRSGPQVIPHFAHYSQSDCPSLRRGEGPYHEKGKLLLYNWLKHQRLNVTLEKYIKEIDQQPDLYVQINQTKIAIEFQCSRIRLRDIQKRTSGYISAKIIPIWILGANVFERKSNYHLKIDQFTLQFIHQFSPQMPLKLFYFCPESLKILVFEDPYVTGRGRAIGNLQFYQLPKLKFTQLFKENPFSKKVLYNLWKSEKKNFRLQRRSQAFGQTRAWYQWLYLQNTRIDYLPSIIHLPIRNQYMMTSPPWNWQSRLYMQVIRPRAIGSLFSMSDCMKAIRNHMHPQNYFPLIKSIENPIREYLNLLTQLSYIEKTNQETYTIIKKPEFYNHIEKSVKNDMMVLDKLKCIAQQTNFKQNTSMNE